MKDNSQYIDDYISGILTREEMEKFESKKEKDPNLENEYQIWAKTREFIKARSMIHEIENDPDLPLAEEMVKEYFMQEDIEIKRRSKLRRGLLILLPAAAIFAGVVLLILHSHNTDPLSRIYSQYYTPLQNKEIQNFVVGDVSDQFLMKGLEYYLNGNYVLAIEQLKQADGSSYFLGLSYLGLKDYENAQKYLDDAFRANSYHSGVSWYLGLTYLKLSKSYLAVDHFKRLFLMDNPYQMSAARILKRLDKYNAAEEN